MPKTYPIAHGSAEFSALWQAKLTRKWTGESGYKHVGYDHTIKAVFSGEKRCPRKGEWYLSGADIEAYVAPNDLSMVFHIAKLVRVEAVITEVIHPLS